MNIRRIANNDSKVRSDLFSLLNDLLPEYSARIKELEQGNSNLDLYVLEEDNQVSGGLVACTCKNSSYGFNHGSVLFAGVLNQKQGYGRALVQTYARDLVKKDVPEIVLDVQKNSLGEQSARKMGFKEFARDDDGQIYLSAKPYEI